MAEKKKLENQIVKPPNKRAQKHLPQLEEGDNTKYLKFSLASNWLVKVDLYDSLIVETSAGLVSTKYATPDEGVKGYMSYGPYKLTKMEAGKSFLIEKNDKWYGYTDGKHDKQYQMDAVYTRIITDHNTALQEFEAGRLDDFGLNRNDMKKYGNSSRLTKSSTKLVNNVIDGA